MERERLLRLLCSGSFTRQLAGVRELASVLMRALQAQHLMRQARAARATAAAAARAEGGGGGGEAQQEEKGAQQQAQETGEEEEEEEEEEGCSGPADVSVCAGGPWGGSPAC